MNFVIACGVALFAAWFLWFEYRLGRLESLWRCGEVYLDRLDTVEETLRAQKEQSHE